MAGASIAAGVSKLFGGLLVYIIIKMKIMRKSSKILAALVAVAAATGLSSCMGLGVTETVGWGIDDLWYNGWGNNYYGGYYGPAYGPGPGLPPPPPPAVRPAPVQPAPQPPTGSGASTTHRPATISPVTPSGQPRPGSTGGTSATPSRPHREQAATATPSPNTTTTGRGRR